MVVLIALVVVAIGLWPSRLSGDGKWVYAWVIELHKAGVPYWFNFAFVERATNVLLFIPVGLALGVILPRRHWWIAILTALAGSVGLEAAQLLLTSRQASPLDILMNSLGALIGVGLSAIVHAVLARSARRREERRRRTDDSPRRRARSLGAGQ